MAASQRPKFPRPPSSNSSGSSTTAPATSPPPGRHHPDPSLPGRHHDHRRRFARYSVDARWLVPHFEKMLYDNAQLLRLLSRVTISETRDCSANRSNRRPVSPHFHDHRRHQRQLRSPVQARRAATISGQDEIDSARPDAALRRNLVSPTRAISRAATSSTGSTLALLDPPTKPV
jgi:hypothetical protein